MNDDTKLAVLGLRAIAEQLGVCARAMLTKRLSVAETNAMIRNRLLLDFGEYDIFLKMLREMERFEGINAPQDVGRMKFHEALRDCIRGMEKTANNLEAGQ